MKVFTYQGFIGFYPVGTAAVVVAPDRLMAVYLLEPTLTSNGLRQMLNKNKMVELATDRPLAMLLCDGNY